MDTTATDHLAAKRQEVLDRKAGKRPESATRPKTARERKRGAADILTQLTEAAQSAERANSIRLHDLSRAYTAKMGTDIEVAATVRALDPREIFASGLLPGPAREVINSFIARSEELTQAQRDNVGLADLALEIAEEEFDGDTVAVMGGFMDLTKALACLGTRELTFNGEPHATPVQLTVDKGDPTRLYIGILTKDDVETIASAVWGASEEEAREAGPFPDPSDAADAVSALQAVEPATERASSV